MIRIFSFGGGVQSVACLVLAAQGRIEYRTFVFANVGDDTENPATVAYIRDVAMPYAFANGIQLITLEPKVTLMEKLMRDDRSIPIPVRMSNGAPGNRSCTVDYKIKPIARFAKKAGAKPDAKAIIGIGISTDEIIRAKPNRIEYLQSEWPLIDLGLSRNDCKILIAKAGLPVPPKSACFFCPFQRLSQWQKLYDEQPQLFAKSVEVENFLIQKRIKIGKDALYLTQYGESLAKVVTGAHQGQTEIDFGLSCGPFLCEGDNSDSELIVKKTR